MERSSSRRERRTHKRAVQRHKKRLQLWLAMGPVLLVIGAVAGLLIALGGPQSDIRHGVQTAATPVQVLPGLGDGRDALVVVKDGPTVSAVVLLHPREAGGTALGIPGATLTCSPDLGFVTLSELYTSRGLEGLAKAILQDLGAAVGAAGEVSWVGLREAVKDQRAGDALPASLTGTEGEQVQKVAEGVLAALSKGVEASAAMSSKAWSGLEDVQTVVTSSKGKWAAEAVWGRLVTGPDYAYVEPYLTRARRALDGNAAGPVMVEVYDSSATSGVVEFVQQILTQLGCRVTTGKKGMNLLSLQTSQLVFSSWTREEAGDICQLLGIRAAVEDSSLGDARVMLFIGKDFIPPFVPKVVSER